MIFARKFLIYGFFFNKQSVHVLTMFYMLSTPPFQDETPLFLAAREGCYESAKLLLDHYANRDITDHMDRLPRDIAQERMHQDIVKLLEEYRVNSPVAMNGFATSPPMPYAHAQHPVSKPGKKKSRKTSNGDHTQPNKVALPPMEKKKKKKGGHHNHHHHHHHGHVDHSSSCAAASLESPQCVMELPPSYETACAGGHSVMPMDISPNTIALEQAALHHRQGLTSDWMEHMQPLPSNAMMQHQNGQYTSQGSPPSAAGSPLAAASSTGGSPSSRMATSPLTQTYGSPTNTTPSPGSITSPGSISPLNQSQSPASQMPVTSPPSVMSPPRKGYPTSPTHLQVIFFPRFLRNYCVSKFIKTWTKGVRFGCDEY